MSQTPQNVIFLALWRNQSSRLAYCGLFVVPHWIQGWESFSSLKSCTWIFFPYQAVGCWGRDKKKEDTDSLGFLHTVLSSRSTRRIPVSEIKGLVCEIWRGIYWQEWNMCFHHPQTGSACLSVRTMNFFCQPRHKVCSHSPTAPYQRFVVASSISYIKVPICVWMICAMLSPIFTHFRNHP